MNDDVSHGRMMSAPAVTCAGKVFAFYSAKAGMAGLGARLGRDYPIADLRLKSWQHLSPFTTKPPMKDWIVVPPEEAARWGEVAEIALTAMRTRGRS